MSDSFIAGYRQALNDAGRCGAYNSDNPPDAYAACTMAASHTGKHDDSWLVWGTATATVEDNRRDATAGREEANRRIAAANAERDVLAAIVRDLAAHKAPYNSEYMYCELCDRQVDLQVDSEGEIDTYVESHAESCTWRRARAWLASQEPTQ